MATKLPSDQVGPTLLAITASLSAFGEFLPPLREVRGHTLDDANFAADVRLGEVAASAFVLGLGAIASSLTGSMAPAIVSLLMVAMLVTVYETALRSIHLFGATNVNL